MLKYKNFQTISELLEQKTILNIDLSGYRKLPKSSDEFSLEAKLESIIDNQDFFSLISLPNNLLASGTVNGEIELWSMNKEKLIARLTGHEGTVYGLVAISERLLASASADKTIKVWDIKSKSCQATLTGHTGAVYSLIYLKDKLISASADKTIKIWNINSTDCVATYNGHSAAVNTLAALSEDSFASGSDDKTIKLWKLSNNLSTATLSPNSGAIQKIISITDERIAAGFIDKTVQIWDVKNKQCQAILEEHFHWISSITKFQNNFLASSSSDNIIKIWDLKILKSINTLQAHKNRVLALATLQDERLVSGAWDEPLLVWTNYPKLVYSDLESIFKKLKSHPELETMVLQYVRLKHVSALTLLSHFSNYSKLKQLDLRNTLITAEVFWQLYDNLIKDKPKSILKIQHESMPYYFLDFSNYVENLQKNPDDKNSMENLLKLAQMSHQRVLYQFHKTLENPKLLTSKLIKKMFSEVCSIIDFKYPYTLLNMAISSGILTVEKKQNWHKEFYESLNWLAKNMAFNKEALASYKLILTSAKKKRLITEHEFHMLDSEAEDCKTFADERFIDLKKQLMELQLQVQNLGTEMRTKVQHLQNQVNTIQHNVQLIAADLNRLKASLKAKAEMEATFGIAKFALNIVTLGLGEVLDACCDLSDFIDISSALPILQDLDTELLDSLVDACKDAIQDIDLDIKDEVINQIMGKLGVEPDHYLQAWIDVRLTLLEFDSEKKDETNSYSKPSKMFFNSVTQSAFLNSETYTKAQNQFREEIQKQDNLMNEKYIITQNNKDLYINCESNDVNILAELNKFLYRILGQGIIYKNIIIDNTLKIKTHTPVQTAQIVDFLISTNLKIDFKNPILSNESEQKVVLEQVRSTNNVFKH